MRHTKSSIVFTNMIRKSTLILQNSIQMCQYCARLITMCTTTNYNSFFEVFSFLTFWSICKVVLYFVHAIVI